jgi:hypothetical protein
LKPRAIGDLDESQSAASSTGSPTRTVPGVLATAGQDAAGALVADAPASVAAKSVGVHDGLGKWFALERFDRMTPDGLHAHGNPSRTILRPPARAERGTRIRQRLSSSA